MVSAILSRDEIKKEFPPSQECLYLNTGSCGRKPQAVLAAINQGWTDFNVNPTITTFIDQSPWELARGAVAKLLNVPANSLLLVQNSTHGLHLLLNSFLDCAPDELITTNHEHGCVSALRRHLHETKGIKTFVHEVDELCDTDHLINGVISLITANTKMILVSELDGFTGQRHDLSRLVEHCQGAGIPLLVDGAHCLGQVICDPARYPMWVASGHKWLGGPNGTGIVYVAPHLVPKLKPVWVGDKHFERKDADINDLRRFESQGTCDVVRWYGLAAAVDLQLRLGARRIYEREMQLLTYLHDRMQDLHPTFRRRVRNDDPRSAMLAFYWREDQVRVPDLKEALWERHKIWVQPDFINLKPHTGVRISCHYCLEEDDIDRFVVALKELIND